ncbi:MAG: GtrA family protein [Selenomonadaceae bacterium]|nr:GtrA family protein [Selenomonadaceae bacterium]
MQKDRFMEMMRFSLVGGASFLLDYGLLYAFVEFCGIHYLIASGLSFTISVIFNYYLCATFVFHASGRTKAQKLLFFGSSVAGLFLNQLCMWLFVDIMGIYYMLSKIFATAIVTLWNYVMKRKALKG